VYNTDVPITRVRGYASKWVKGKWRDSLLYAIIANE
jgi:hypothetical protein